MAKSKDERAQLAAIKARNKAFEAGGGRKNMTAEDKAQIKADNPVSTMGGFKQGGRQYFATGEDGKRSLQDINEDSNPFKVDSLDDYDATAYGVGAAKGVNRISIAELRGMHKQGGFDLQDIRDHAAENDIQISGYAKKYLDKKLGEVTAPPSDDGGGSDDGDSGGGSDGGDDGGDVYTPSIPDRVEDPYTPPPSYGPPRPIVPGMPGSGVSIGGDLNQNIGKTGDMNTTIGDGNTFGADAQIGNDNSVTIGSQNVGGGSANANAAGFLQSQAKAKSQAYLNFS